MRTVSSLCAFGAGIALAPTGLAVVREPLDHHQHHPHRPSAPSRAPAPSSRSEMTSAVASTATYQHTLPQARSPLPFAFSTPPPRTPRVASEPHTRDGKTRSGDARVGQKRTLTPRTSFSLGGIERRPSTRQGAEQVDGATPRPASSRHSSSAPRPSWMRRLSSNMPGSRDPDQQAASRPSSVATSNPNGDLVSSDVSLQDHTATPPPSLPNKLVKRSTSMHSANGSPFSSPGSRLPVPVFRRPATSHQRSAEWQSRPSTADAFDRMSLDDRSDDSRDQSFRHYFTPKMAPSEVAQPQPRLRSSSNIPNPIKRVYPDRKYTPMLVSANQYIRPAPVEVDDVASEDDGGEVAATVRYQPDATASSPFPATASHFPDSQVPRRSFSIGNLLSPHSQSSRRPASSQGGRGRPSAASRTLRKANQRIVSAPQPSMGGLFSKAADADSEPPTKRRDLTDPALAPRSIYSSSSGSRPTDTETSHDNDLHSTPQTPQSAQFPPRHPLTADRLSRGPASSPFGVTPLPYDPTTSQPARLSGARSDFTSTIGSDSDKSVGDVSTDGQTDTPYDSYPTRTTRSSFGKRGPHIETIFDDSPPQFSSGRSTRLRDILDDGAYGSGGVSRYRHSTIEEEESILSTPRRSVHDKSITSTPSARPGTARLVFNSSPPPAMAIMPDPDEIDWGDAPDDDEDDDGPSGSVFGGGAGFAPPSHHPSTTETRLPFRLLGPALRHPDNDPNTAEDSTTTPQRPPNSAQRLFDWSEAIQPSPSHHHNHPNSLNQTPPRPRTVHGKKDPENRGSRAPGRRAPSAMHARSHSVPVVPPDADGKRNTAAVVSNKFGTWGVGSKAATEDWNEDFEFDEPALLPATSSALTSSDPHNSNTTNTNANIAADGRRVDSGHVMLIPRSIREQQENVVANISLLREWGILIEELKELRIRAVALQMLAEGAPFAQEWREVDAMIDLADQETEEVTLEARRSPPSSPGFDYAAFEEQSGSLAAAATGSSAGAVGEGLATMSLPGPAFPATMAGTGTRSFSSPQPELSSSQQQQQQQPSATPTRPRKDSEAVARSVIEALQAKRSIAPLAPSSSSTTTAAASSTAAVPPVPHSPIAPPITAQRIPPPTTPSRTETGPSTWLSEQQASQNNATRKVPFDTATLRHIVPYVAGLKRKVKDALRETEGLYTSPRARSSSRGFGGAERVAGHDDELESDDGGEGGKAGRLGRRAGALTDHYGAGREDELDAGGDDDDDQSMRDVFDDEPGR